MKNTFRTDRLTVLYAKQGGTLITQVDLRAGEVFATFHEFQVSSTPSYQSIQIAENLHLQDLGVLAFMNHSCEPNICIDTAALQGYALREIKAGEELRFFYPSTEWRMAQPFFCQCGSAHCLGEIQGAAFVASEVLAHYFINVHILNRIKGRV